MTDSTEHLRPINISLYSALHRALAKAPYAKASYDTWHAWLKALTRKGVSSAEWEWISDFSIESGEANHSISLDILCERLMQNDQAHVDIFLREAVVYPTLTFFSFARAIPEGDKPWNHPLRPQACWQYYNPVHDFRIVSQRNRSVLGYSEDWMVLNRHWELWRYKKIRSPYFVSAHEAKRWCQNIVKTLMPRKHGFHQPSQEWASYITEGGTHYREWLITLPNHTPVFDAAEHNTHFQVNNVIAHLRTTDRRIDGNDVLFIEEVQSDWNQQLRYADADIRALYDNPYRTQWLTVALRVALLIAAKENKEGLAIATGEMNEDRYRGAHPGLVHFYDVIVRKELGHLAKALSSSLQTPLLYLSNAAHPVPVAWLSPSLRQQLIQRGLPRLGAVPQW